MSTEDDILTVLIQTSRQNLEPGELAKKIAAKLKSRDDGLVDALENDIRELRGASPGEMAARLVEQGWILRAMPDD